MTAMSEAYEQMTDTAQEQERVERYFLRYMSHRRTCRYGRDTPDGDYCTCGLAIAKQALRKRLRARQREGGPDVPIREARWVTRDLQSIVDRYAKTCETSRESQLLESFNRELDRLKRYLRATPNTEGDERA